MNKENENPSRYNVQHKEPGNCNFMAYVKCDGAKKSVRQKREAKEEESAQLQAESIKKQDGSDDAVVSSTK